MGEPDPDYPSEPFAGFVGIETYCRNCSAAFSSKSKLHKHLHSCTKANPQLAHLTEQSASEPTISSKPSISGTPVPELRPSATPLPNLPKMIISKAPQGDMGSGFGFRAWNYAQVTVRLSPTAKDIDVCADTGCGVSLVDRQ